MRTTIATLTSFLLASTVIAQNIGPLPAVRPYVPPTAAVRLPGRAAVQALLPNVQETAGAAYFSAGIQDAYDRLMFSRRPMQLARTVAAVPTPEPDRTRAVITLQVPDKADVYVEGRRMAGAGPERTITSPPLEPGRRYEYAVAVRWNTAGVSGESKLTIPISAGDRPVYVILAPPAR